MHRLSGMDQGFLALELPVQPMHNMLLTILRTGPSEDSDTSPLTLDDLRQHVAARLDGLPWFRWRLVEVPFDLYHPVLIEDPGFILEDHLYQVTLPKPGGRDELDRFCAQQAGQHLDRSRPLWEMTLVDGLADGRQAILFKNHHCMSDGRAALFWWSQLFSESPAEEIDAWRPEPVPGRMRLLRDAMRDYRRALRGFPRFARKASRDASTAKKRRAELDVRVPEAWVDAPPGPLNNGFTVQRGYARAQLSMDDVNAIRRVGGASVNDVVLTVVSEALRRYLCRRGGLPERSLVAGVIVGIEPPDAPPRLWGNRLTSMTTSLCTDIDDLWDRMRQIHDVTAASRELLDLSGRSVIADGLQIVPPWFAKFVVRQGHRHRVRHPERIGTNVVVSHFRGFSSPATAPALVEEAYFSGPPNGGVGVNISMWSYTDRLMITVATFMDSMDTPQELAEAIEAAMGDLGRRAQRENPSGTV